MKTVVLVPTYNEKDNIKQLIPRIFSAAPAVFVTVVDDRSPDGTAEEVKRLQAHYPRLSLYQRDQKEGLGRAYADAMKHVLEDIDISTVCTIDADWSHDPAYLPPMLAQTSRYDVVIGSRYTAGGAIAGWELWRKLLSRAGNIYTRLVTRLPVADATSGFHCIRAERLRALDFTSFTASGYGFQIYLKYQLWQRGATLLEFPIIFRERVHGKSKMSTNIIREGLLLPWWLIKKKPASKNIRCPICGAASRFWFNKNKTDLYRCLDCRLIFIYPVPAQTAHIYTDDYFCGSKSGFGYVNYEIDFAPDNQTFHTYLNKIEKYCSDKGSLLDVGAATGTFLLAAQSRGWLVRGVEISGYGAQQGQKKGLDVRLGTLDTIAFEPSSFNVITLWDVLEHVPDPAQTLKQIHALLKPGGLLVMNLPDAGSWFAHAAGRFWPLIVPPEHVCLFNLNNLERLLSRHQFSLIHKAKIGKRFKPAYIFQVMYTIKYQKIWKKIADAIKKTPLNRMSIPLKLRDNMFVIARKN